MFILINCTSATSLDVLAQALRWQKITKLLKFMESLPSLEKVFINSVWSHLGFHQLFSNNKKCKACVTWSKFMNGMKRRERFRREVSWDKDLAGAALGVWCNLEQTSPRARCVSSSPWRHRRNTPNPNIEWQMKARDTS